MKFIPDMKLLSSTFQAGIVATLMLFGVSTALAQPPEIRPGRSEVGAIGRGESQRGESQRGDNERGNVQAGAADSSDTPSVDATDALQPVAEPDVTEQDIDQLTARLSAAAEVPEETKQSIAGKIKAAADSVSRAKKLSAQTSADQKAIAETASKAEALRVRLAEKPTLLEELSDPTSTLPDLVSKLAALQPELQNAREKVRQWEAEAARRSERRSAITAELTSNPNAVAELRSQLSLPASADSSALEVDARRTMLKAQLQELNNQVPAYKAELARYDAEKAGDLINLQLQLAQRSEAKLQQQTERLTKLITDKRRADARYVADQLRAFARGEDVASPYKAGSDLPEVGKLKAEGDLETARQTAENAETNVTVTAEVASTAEKVASAAARLEGIRDLVAGMNNKIDRVGLTGAIGLELRKHLKGLPDTRLLTADGRKRQKSVQDIDFLRLELEDELKDAEKRLATIRTAIEQQPSDIELRLLVDKHESLKQLTASYSDQFDRLIDLDIKEKELIREVDKYRSFIQEQVLWIRSHRPPSFDDLGELKSSLVEVTRKEKWIGILQWIWDDMKSVVWIYTVFTLLVVLLLGIQKRFRKSLAEIAEVAKKPSCRSFRITIRGAVLTTVLAAAWPSLPAFLSWRLLQEDVSGSFPRAVGEGLKAFAAGFFTLNVLRHLCRPSGLGPVHFGWPSTSAKMLRRETYRLIWLLLPLLFSKAMLHTLSLSGAQVIQSLSAAQVLERVVFVSGLLVMAWFQARVLHPNHGIFANWAHRAGRWIYQLRWIVFGAIIGLPLVLAIMAAMGFYYTAYELSWRLNVTTWVVISLLILRSFLMRLFLVQHRQLRLEQAKAKRQALVENAGSQTDQIPAAVVEEVVDLKEVSSQSKRLSDSMLIIAGLLLTAFVWADVHPALSVLDKWTVWDTTVEKSVAYVDEDDGASKVRTDQLRVPITVADCLVSLAILALTVTATRNLPGFLEITVLQRLPIEPSVRYALRMVSQYFLVVIGTLMAFTNIGIGWDKVQWLAAALTVGLGFGLQEIFANFISGLIILFERPIRISDVVTIGDVSGSVSQIRMRATTITDWDLKEYIVPNKEFITGRLLNWTLSDKVNRVVIEVGVAYGTDTQLARSLLIEAATDLEEVMKDPGPLATFEQFGGSTLNLRLRCYLPNLENRLATITELHENIDAKFKAANIEISFPQLDLHVVDIPKAGD